MNASGAARGFGATLFALLESYGVEVVFGIPGVHTVELYRGLEGGSIRHVTPRHEQGAGFMADGYARACGQPGVCLVITGPGLSNIATAMLQAEADSIPMLVISGVNDPLPEGGGRRLHEMPDQAAFARTAARRSIRVENAAALAPALAEAFALFTDDRPGPVHLEVPLSVMKTHCHQSDGSIGTATDHPPPDRPSDHVLAALQTGARPLILAGGGIARSAGEAVLALAERLGAPVVTTANARSALPRHPLVVHASASLTPVHELIVASDRVIAIGTELGQTDYDVHVEHGRQHLEGLVRIDLDERPAGPMSCLHWRIDAGYAAAQLLSRMSCETQSRTASTCWADLDRVRAASIAALTPAYQADIRWLDALRERVPGAIFVGDSTELVYAGNLAFAPDATGGWFNSATGFGTLGYALSAAIGAKLARPSAPVICLIGDGGLQFTLAELGTLRDAGLPVTVVVWNNDGYGEIRDYMLSQHVQPAGVDLPAPDFVAIAVAFGLKAQRVNGADAALDTISTAVASGRSTLIDLRI